MTGLCNVGFKKDLAKFLHGSFKVIVSYKEIGSDKFVKIAEQANFTARFQFHSLPYILGAVIPYFRNIISKEGHLESGCVEAGT